MNTKKVYVLLSDTGTVLTKIIRLYTKCPLNHASIAFDENLEELYSFGRKKINNPFNGGFVKENIQSELFKNAQCAVYSCTVTEFEYYQLRRSIKKMEKSKQKYRYNFLGLFFIMFDINVERKYAFFCTQFVATLFNEIGISIVNKPPSLVTPQDLMEANQLNLLYQGNINSYPLANTRNEIISNNYYFTNTIAFIGDSKARTKATVVNAFRKMRALI